MLGYQSGGLQLIAKPNMVEKIDIQYAKFAKKVLTSARLEAFSDCFFILLFQVDVKALKQSLWTGLDLTANDSSPSRPEQKFLAPRSFQQTISSL